MGKITIKYIKQKRCASVYVNDTEYFAVYVQVILHCKSTHIPFALSDFGDDFHLVYTDANGLIGLNNGKIQNETYYYKDYVGKDFKSGDDFVTDYIYNDGKGYIYRLVHNKITIENQMNYFSRIEPMVNYYETIQKTDYDTSKRSIRNDLQLLTNDAFGLLLMSALEYKGRNKFFGEIVLDSVNIVATRYQTENTKLRYIDRLVKLVLRNPNTYYYYKALFEKFLNINFDSLFPTDFINDWKYISDLETSLSGKSLIEWFKTYDGKDNTINELLRNLNFMMLV